jgi:hypothetical protein
LTVLRFEERDLPDVIYIEQLTGAIYLDQRSDVEHYPEVVDEPSGGALTRPARRASASKMPGRDDHTPRKALR